ncbi:MAG: hypothetical protein QGG88_03900 [Gammaproteobacteria bacterium]|nr:hypothetical protein [Gammaproteobacteria bacterium]
MAVAEHFLKRGRRRVPVVADGVLVGQLSHKDILHAVNDFVANN